MDEFRKRFGRRVRELREARGMSLQELADKLDIQLSHLSNIETGRYAIGFARLQLLAAALACDVADLFLSDSEPDES